MAQIARERDEALAEVERMRAGWNADVEWANKLLLERDEALREVEELRDLLRKAWAFPNYPAGSEAEYDMLDEQIRKALDT